LGNVNGNVAGSVGTVQNRLNVNVAQISGDSVAADNAESFFDGTGYAGTNNTIPTVTTTGTATNVTMVNGLANNVITAASINANAITAAKIADDAIDYGTFAGTAPAAWWNEGKTGYSLTGAERRAIGDSVLWTYMVGESYDGDSSKFGEYIRNFDNFTGTIDSSQLAPDVLNAGKLLAGTIGASEVSAAEDQEIAVAVLETDISSYTGSGYVGTYLKNLYDNQNWNVWDDGTRTLTNVGFGDTLNQTLSILKLVQAYNGAGNWWKQYYMPFGSANKDSLRIVDSTGAWKGTLYFNHNSAVMCSSIFKK
jgi:hypothetical protein